MLLIWLITDDVNIDHLAKVVFAQFFHCLSPLPILCSLKARHGVQPTLQGGRWGCVKLYFLERVSACIIWNSSEKICLSSSLYLFNHYISMDLCMFLYALNYDQSWIAYSFAQIISSLTIGRLTSEFLWHVPILLFLELFLTFWHYKYSGLIFFFFCKDFIYLF